MMTKYLLVIFSFFSFWGCTSSSIEFPADSKPKIVLYGFFSPQGAKLNISQSAPAGQELSLDSVFLNDAIPVIQKINGEVLDTMVSVDNLGNYKFSKHVNLEANKSYLVKVFCDGFESATTIIEIPKSMPTILPTVENLSMYTKIVSLDFDVIGDAYYLFQVDGYDGDGVKRLIEEEDDLSNENNECPLNWTLPLFFVQSSCLRNSNPRISAKIYNETTNWDTGERIALKKVRYRISYVDENYKNIFERIDDLLLGFAEPILTEGFVDGGYGFIVPYNAPQEIDVYL